VVRARPGAARVANGPAGHYGCDPCFPFRGDGGGDRLFATGEVVVVGPWRDPGSFCDVVDAYDLDLASPGIVKMLEDCHADTYPDMAWEPKAAFATLAECYRS
jgi:hypothetical protein